MTIREIGLIGCAATAALALARMLFLLRWRRPVIARTISTDYTDMERTYDRDFRIVALADNAVNAHDIPFKSVLARARYEWNGVEYVEDVPVYVRKGDPPDRQLILWIDPDDPSKPTSKGIGVAAVWLLGIGGLAVGFWHIPF